MAISRKRLPTPFLYGGLLSCVKLFIGKQDSGLVILVYHKVLLQQLMQEGQVCNSIAQKFVAAGRVNREAFPCESLRFNIDLSAHPFLSLEGIPCLVMKCRHRNLTRGVSVPSAGR